MINLKWAYKHSKGELMYIYLQLQPNVKAGWALLVSLPRRGQEGGSLLSNRDREI